MGRRPGGGPEGAGGSGHRQVCAMRLRSTEAAEWAPRAIDASTDPALTTTAMSILVPCLGRVGRPAEALAAAASLHRDGSGAAFAHVEALLGRGMVRLWVDDLERACADFNAVLAACRQRPASRQALVALGMLADTEYRLGAWDDSIVHAAQVVSLVEDSEQVWMGAFAHAAATWVLAPRGDAEGAQAHAHAAAVAGRVMGDATSMGCAATAAAHAAFFRDDLCAAVQAVQPMLELGDVAAADEPSVHPWRELHVEALLRLGRLNEAEVALEALEALAESRDRRTSRAHATRLRAGFEAAAGHHEAARTAFECALVRAQDIASPFERARAHNDYGLVSATSGAAPAGGCPPPGGAGGLYVPGRRSPGPPVPAGAERVRAASLPPHHAGVGRAHTPGAGGGSPGEHGADQPRGGHRARGEPQDGRVPPGPRLRQAESALADGVGRPPGRARRLSLRSGARGSTLGLPD